MFKILIFMIFDICTQHFLYQPYLFFFQIQQFNHKREL